MERARYPFALRVSWPEDGSGVRRLPAMIEPGQLLRARVTITGVFASRNVVVVPMKGVDIN